MLTKKEVESIRVGAAMQYQGADEVARLCRSHEELRTELINMGCQAEELAERDKPCGRCGPCIARD